MASAKHPSGLEKRTRRHHLDLTPPTDNRPYFFNMLTLRSLWSGQFRIDTSNVTLAANLSAIYSLLFSLLVSLFMTLLLLIGPMVGRSNELQPLPKGELTAIFGYFALIGLGFMFVEIGLLARLNIFLGHPTLSLAVVLGGIIFFTGLGSLISESVPVTSRMVLVAYPMTISLIVALLAGWLDPLLDAVLTFNTTGRILVSLGCLGVVALPMGFAFPVGLRAVNHLAETRGWTVDVTPWLWCLNGATSVLGSGLGLLVALEAGIRSVLLTGSLLYLLLCGIFPFLLQTHETESRISEDTRNVTE